MNTPIYLDYAAATPLDTVAMQAMQPYFTERFYNPSAVYEVARSIYRDIEAARSSVAQVLGARQQEIVFTAGGTEANNLAIRGVMERYKKGHLVVSSIEHESILEVARQFPHTVVGVDNSGLVDLVALKKAIRDDTVLVSIMYANNEIGTIQPLKEIAAIVRETQAERNDMSTPGHHLPLLLHTDACQAANYLDIQVGRLGVDMMTLNGGKIYGPKQSGALYVHRDIDLKPLIVGGGQERGLRSGTENTAAIIGFAAMLHKVQQCRKDESLRLEAIRQQSITTLAHELPNIQINGHAKKHLPNSLSITIPKVDGERLVMELDNVGVLVATGSACSASKDQPSHVLRAIGLSPEHVSSSLRITFGQPTNTALAAEAVDRIAAVIQKHRS